MQKQDCFTLGHISRRHGLKGEVIAVLETDRPEAYTEMESVLIEIQSELVPFFISTIGRNPKGHFILKFEDIDTTEEADRLIGKELFLPEDFLPPLEGDAYYYHEILDFEVVDGEHGAIGHLREVVERSQQALLSIEHPSGATILVPLVEEFVLEVKREEKRIEVALPPGLLELYLSDEQ